MKVIEQIDQATVDGPLTSDLQITGSLLDDCLPKVRRRLPVGVILAGFDAAAIGVAVAAHGSLFWGQLAATGVLLLFNTLNGAYRKPRVSLSAMMDMKSTLTTAATPLVMAGVALSFHHGSLASVRFAGALIPAIGISRAASYRFVRSMRRRGHLLHHVVMIGVGSTAQQIAAYVSERPDMGLQVAGFVEDLEPDEPSPAGWLGRIDELPVVIRSNRVGMMIIASTRLSDDELSKRLRTIETLPVELFVVPRLHDFGSSAGDVRTQNCGGTPIVWLPHRAWRREQLVMKRSFDILVASTAMTMLSPLMLLTAVLVRLTSPGPVLFHQTRVGKDGCTFEMLKFRSMRVADDAEMRQSGGGDPRITLVGKVIRRLSIDELPQFLNVLKGEMSIVGPRPEQPFFVEASADVPRYAERHRLQVGLTGWSQVNRLRGGQTSPEDRARFDNYYIEHWSLWLDLVVMMRTAAAALRGS